MNLKLNSSPMERKTWQQHNDFTFEYVSDPYILRVCKPDDSIVWHWSVFFKKELVHKKTARTAHKAKSSAYNKMNWHKRKLREEANA